MRKPKITEGARLRCQVRGLEWPPSRSRQGEGAELKSLPSTPLVKITASGRLCIPGQVCLLKSVLVGTHVVVRLEIDIRYRLISFVHVGD